MKTVFYSGALLSAVLLAGCTPETSGGAVGVSMDAARSATTAEELVALGAHRLSEAEFRAELVDVALGEGTWTWTIHSNGTHSSAANDGSWTDAGGTWRLVNGEYCRAVKAKGNAETCSAAYRLGDVYRFTDSGDSGKLATWWVTRG